MDTFNLAKRVIKPGYSISIKRNNLYSYVVEVFRNGITSLVTIDKFVEVGYEYETVKEALQIAYDEIKQKGGSANA